jgi:hypothetical protein
MENFDNSGFDSFGEFDDEPSLTHDALGGDGYDGMEPLSLGDGSFVPDTPDAVGAYGYYESGDALLLPETIDDTAGVWAEISADTPDIASMSDGDREIVRVALDTFARDGEQFTDGEWSGFKRKLAPEMAEVYGIPYQVTVYTADTADSLEAISAITAKREVTRTFDKPEANGGGEQEVFGLEEKTLRLTPDELIAGVHVGPGVEASARVMLNLKPIGYEGEIGGLSFVESNDVLTVEEVNTILAALHEAGS